jgi:hypothetical protein
MFFPWISFAGTPDYSIGIISKFSKIDGDIRSFGSITPAMKQLQQYQLAYT